jgi:hypothetical protein
VVGVAEEEEDIKVEDNLEGIGRIEDNQWNLDGKGADIYNDILYEKLF